MEIVAVKLRVLDLFSGIGGFSLGLERTGGFETVAFCEIEPFCQKVLAKHWPGVPCYDDVRTLTAASGIGAVDVICGGYPCQPFSTAGKRAGDKDDRHLWPEVRRLLDEFRPAWFIGENVAGHISLGLDEVLSDLEALNYTARPFVVPACAVDAPHRRDRVWIVSHANEGCKSDGPVNAEASELRGLAGVASNGISKRSATGKAGKGRKATLRNINGDDKERQEQFGLGGDGSILADAAGQRQQGQGQSGKRGCAAQNGEGQANQPFAIRFNGKWPVEPAVGRVAHGVSNRVDRLKALGNAVVPQIPELIGRAILETHVAE